MAGFKLADLRILVDFLDGQLDSPRAKAEIRRRNRSTNYVYVQEQIRELSVGNAVVGTGIKEVDNILYEILTTRMMNDIYNNGLGVCQYEDARRIYPGKLPYRFLSRIFLSKDGSVY